MHSNKAESHWRRGKNTLKDVCKQNSVQTYCMIPICSNFNQVMNMLQSVTLPFTTNWNSTVYPRFMPNYHLLNRSFIPCIMQDITPNSPTFTDAKDINANKTINKLIVVKRLFGFLAITNYIYGVNRTINNLDGTY